MPFRRRSRLLDELTEQLKTQKKPLESMHVLGLIELLVERIYASVKILLAIAIVLAVISIGLEIQVQGRNHTIEKIHQSVDATREAANKAQDAANKADDDLTKAVTAAAQGSQASADAIDSIHRIESQLCGGTCPMVTTTVPGR